MCELIQTAVRLLTRGGSFPLRTTEPQPDRFTHTNEADDRRKAEIFIWALLAVAKCTQRRSHQVGAIRVCWSFLNLADLPSK